jgi:hypothetical protein
MRRCQRSSVSGCTRNTDQRTRGRQTSQRCKQRAVPGLQAGPWMLAAQHSKLMTQHQNLDLLASADRQQSRISSRLRRSAT